MTRQVPAKVCSDLRDHLIIIVILGVAILLRAMMTS